jgi:hypothetical protein
VEHWFDRLAGRFYLMPDVVIAAEKQGSLLFGVCHGFNLLHDEYVSGWSLRLSQLYPAV